MKVIPFLIFISVLFLGCTNKKAQYDDIEVCQIFLIEEYFNGIDIESRGDSLWTCTLREVVNNKQVKNYFYVFNSKKDSLHLVSAEIITYASNEYNSSPINFKASKDHKMRIKTILEKMTYYKIKNINSGFSHLGVTCKIGMQSGKCVYYIDSINTVDKEILVFLTSTKKISNKFYIAKNCYW